ncbi:MAG TPA: outer membrane beta-barrel protein [Thermoanaerobaculia bacterium]
MRKYAFLLLLLLLPTTVFAQYRDRSRYYTERDNSFEITPLVGYRWGGQVPVDQLGFFGHLQAESSAAFGGIVSIPIGDSGFKIELMANHQSTQLEEEDDLFDPGADVADFDVTYIHAGLRIPFATSRNAQPFFVVSAGIANLDPKIVGLTDENRFSASAGVGVKLPISRNVGFRFEGRGYFTAIDENRDDDCVFCNDQTDDFFQGEASVGIVFSF